MANPFDSWIDGAPVVQSGAVDSGDFSKWIDGRVVLEVIGAKTTFLTPQTGELDLTGLQVYLRPIQTFTGSLDLTGQQAVLGTGIVPQTGTLSATGQAVGGTPSLSTIVSVEYTGDGSSPRTFESFGTTPLAVMVIGKDGSGNVVGAIKTADMPSGKSQPFQVNKAAGDSTRSNRILDLTSTGFTVGSDLNVSGQKYAYIIFPKGRDSVVTAGTFIGPGGKQAVNSGVFVPSGSGVISGTNVFTSTGDEQSGWARPLSNTVYSPGVPLIMAGRRMIRNSDGAVILEVTSSIDANSANGIGYISGLIGGTLWHWEEYYVDLKSQVCDMAILMVGDTTGTPGLPVTIVKPSEMGGTNADWAGNGYGELDIYLGSDTDTALHINNRAGGGPLGKGLAHYFLTFHDDEADTGVKLHTFTWTGTGALGTPPTLAGMDFAPDWAFVFDNAGGQNFSWSKNTSNILAANLHDRAVADGSGDSAAAALVSWDSGGVTLAAGGDWNGNGVVYLGIFLKADAAITGIIPNTGALALTGEQPTVQVSSGPVTTSITPNTAELHLTGKQPTVTPHVTAITPSTGSLIFTPRNPTRAQKRTITPKAAALAFSGKAVKTKETHSPGPPPKKFHEQPDTGELQIIGQQPLLKRGIVPGTGALSVTGQKPFVHPPDTPIFTQSGALSLQGQQPQQIITITPRTGALVADGRAVILHLSFPTRITIDTAELGLVGQQPPVGTSLIPATGELQLQTFNTEPIVEANVTKITPRTGTLTIDGISEDSTPEIMTDFLVTPFTGDLNLQGQEPIVQEHNAGDVFITPSTGVLNFVGQPVVITRPSPPVPPAPPTETAGGGVGFPHPRKLPFWPKPVAIVRGRIVEPAASFKGRGHGEENELELLLDIL